MVPERACELHQARAISLSLFFKDSDTFVGTVGLFNIHWDVPKAEIGYWIHTHHSGKGLMIGFDLPDEMKDLRKKLLFDHHIFTGEAKPNTIRLLPALSLRKKDADVFLEAIKEEIHILQP